jgi:hypothetical protein
MPRFVVPEGCKGIDMEDGTHYRVVNGSVDIDNPHHAEAIRRNESTKRGLILDGVRFTKAPGSVRVCCRRSMWAWEAVCPMCGKDPNKEEN